MAVFINSEMQLRNDCIYIYMCEYVHIHMASIGYVLNTLKN